MPSVAGRDGAVAPCVSLNIKGAFIRKFLELDVKMRAGETQTSRSRITSFSQSGFCVREHDGTSLRGLFCWVELLLSAGSASAVLHVVGDMLHEEFKTELQLKMSWQTFSFLLFIELSKTFGYKKCKSSVN